MTRSYKLTTLGAVDLADADGTRVMSVCAQPKRLALLAFIVVEGRHGPVSRDRVCALFWPEADQERARANLRNALHFLRRSLGADVVEGVGKGLVVRSDAIDCDALRALQSGEGEGSQRIATFFEGFHVQGAGWGFEDWVANIRRTVSDPGVVDEATEPPNQPEPTQPPGESPTWLRTTFGSLLATVVVAVVVGSGLALRNGVKSAGQSEGARALARELFDEALAMPMDRDRDANLAAEELLHQAIRIDSTFSDAYALLAQVLGTRAMFIGGAEHWADSATRVAESAVQVDPEAAFGYRALSFAHFQQSRFQDAMAAGLQYLNFEPAHPLILNNLGFISIYRGNHYDAIKWALEAIEQDPEWAVPRTLVALSLAELGRHQEALHWLDSAYEADPTWPPTPSFEVSVLLRSDRLADAERRLDEFGSDDPNLRATVAIAAGDLPRALASLHESYGRAPDYMPPYGISTRTRLGLVLLELGRLEEAEPLLMSATQEAHREMDEGNESKNYRLEMASIEAARGEVDSAIWWLREAYRFGWREDALFLIRPGLKPLVGDPRYEDLLTQIAQAHEQSLTRLDREELPGDPPPLHTTPD